MKKCWQKIALLRGAQVCNESILNEVPHKVKKRAKNNFKAHNHLILGKVQI